MGLEEFKSQKTLNAAAGVESSHRKMGRVGGLSQEPMGLRWDSTCAGQHFPAFLSLAAIRSEREQQSNRLGNTFIQEQFWCTLGGAIRRALLLT